MAASIHIRIFFIFIRVGWFFLESHHKYKHFSSSIPHFAQEKMLPAGFFVPAYFFATPANKGFPGTGKEWRVHRKN